MKINWLKITAFFYLLCDLAEKLQIYQENASPSIAQCVKLFRREKLSRFDVFFALTA